MTITTIFIGFLIVTSGLWFYRQEGKNKALKIEAAFSGRAPLKAVVFYEKHFQESGVPLYVVTGIRDVLEKHLDADLFRLSAEDDFSKNISFFWDFDSIANVEIICELEKRFKIKIEDVEAESAKTIRDIVQLVSSKVSAHDKP